LSTVSLPAMYLTSTFINFGLKKQQKNKKSNKTCLKTILLVNATNMMFMMSDGSIVLMISVYREEKKEKKTEKDPSILMKSCYQTLGFFETWLLGSI